MPPPLPKSKAITPDMLQRLKVQTPQEQADKTAPTLPMTPGTKVKDPEMSSPAGPDLGTSPIGGYDPDPDRPNPLDEGQAMTRSEIMKASRDTLAELKATQRKISGTSRVPPPVTGGKRFAMALAGGIAPVAFQNYRKEAWMKANMVVTQMEKDWEMTSKMMDHLGGVMDDLQSPQAEAAHYSLVEETRKAGIHEEGMTDQEMQSGLNKFYKDEQDDAEDEREFGEVLKLMGEEMDELTTEHPEIRADYLEFMAGASPESGKRVIELGQFMNAQRKKIPELQSRAHLSEVGMKAGYPPPAPDAPESEWLEYKGSIDALNASKEGARDHLTFRRATASAAGGAQGLAESFAVGSWQYKAIKKAEAEGQKKLLNEEERHQAMMQKYEDMHDYRLWRTNFLKSKGGAAGLTAAENKTVSYYSELRQRQLGLVGAAEMLRQQREGGFRFPGTQPPPPTAVESMMMGKAAELEITLADVEPFYREIMAKRKPPEETPADAAAGAEKPGAEKPAPEDLFTTDPAPDGGKVNEAMMPYNDEPAAPGVEYNWDDASDKYEFKGRSAAPEQLKSYYDYTMEYYQRNGLEATNKEIWDRINDLVEANGDPAE